MSLTPEQLAARRTGLGGSDAGAIVGVNPYSGAFDVWARFHLPREGEDDDDLQSQPAHWGDVLEPAIADEYARREGVPLERSGTVRHTSHDWMIAHPDRLIPAARRVIEVKTAGLRQAHRWGPEGSDEIPEEYRLQVAHYLAVLDYRDADVAVLIGGQDFRVYRIERDLEIEAALIEVEEEFWQRCIVGGEQPALDTSPSREEWIARLYPSARLPEREPTDDDVSLALAYAEAREESKRADEAKEIARARLCEAIADAEGFRWGRRGKATWTSSAGKTATDWQAVALEAGVTEAQVLRHTTIRPGPRVLRVTVAEE